MISRFRFGEFRLDQGLTDSTEGFWPSLVDMIALMMIVFMMVFAVVMIKNWDHLVKLKKAMEIERAGMLLPGGQAVEGAQHDPDAGEALYSMRLWEVETERDALIASREKGENEIAQLKAQNQESAKKAESSGHALERLDRQSLEGQALLIDERRQREQLAVEYDKLRERLRESDEKVQKAAKELQRAKEQNEALAKKIERSLKPSRSAVDKHVVEVAYLKTIGGVSLSLKTPGGGVAEKVAPDELLARLDALKKRYPDTLFMRIVFQPGSLATPRESWDFARNLLNKYDYYYAVKEK